ERTVIAWRESGCGLPSYDRFHTGFRWGRRDASTGAWTFNTITDPTCVFNACPGLRAVPPALAVRPSDGAPFYFFGRVGPNGYYYAARVNLDADPTGVNSDAGLIQTLGVAVSDSFAADFPPDASDLAAPDLMTFRESPLALNGVALETGGVQADYAAGPAG